MAAGAVCQARSVVFSRVKSAVRHGMIAYHGRGQRMDEVVVRPRAAISAEERARRKAAIDYARGSVRLEGFVLNAAAEELNRRYIDDEITSAEHSAAIRSNLAL